MTIKQNKILKKKLTNTGKVSTQPKPQATEKRLRKVENALYEITKEVESLRDDILFPLILERVKKDITSREIETVYAVWLQEKFDIGYSRAIRFLTKLQKKGFNVSISKK